MPNCLIALVHMSINTVPGGGLHIQLQRLPIVCNKDEHGSLVFTAQNALVDG